MEDIKIYYVEVLANLTLQELSALVGSMQKQSDEYGGYTVGQYYLLLSRSPLCDQFIEKFLRVV